MKLSIFLSGISILATGVAALSLLPHPHSYGFLEGALKLGGGIVICGIFSIKMPWHGIIGAGVLALLGTGRGLANLPDLVKFASGERSRGLAPILEFAVTVLCAILLVRVLRVLHQERVRRMLEAE